MLDICFSQKDIATLFKERYSHPHPWVQKRMEALYLKSQGLPHGDIRRLIKISSRTLVRWIRMYQEGGVDALKKLGWKGAKGALAKHRETLEEHFKKHPPISLKEACSKIKELTGVERRKIAVRDFLRSLGMSFRKTGNVPGKADPVKQEEFKKKRWNRCSKKQKTGNVKSSSSMQPISYGRGSWVLYGA
jgi:transposase